MAALDFPDAPSDAQAFSAPNGVLYVWNATMGLWVEMHDDPTATGLFASPGIIIDFGGMSAPNGWYLCDGALVNREIDAALFAAIGETFGEGDGETTFALPDLRGCVTAGVDADAGWMLGMQGGESAHMLTSTEMPAHTHSVGDPGHVHYDSGHVHGVGDPGHAHYLAGAPNSWVGVYFANMGGYDQNVLWNEWLQGNSSNVWAGWGYTNLAPSGTGIWLTGIGANQPHNNVQPTMALNKIIKR